MSERHDSRFSLPEVDAPAATEAGVILLGLDADRLLAGLAVARLADDPALVTQVVDQARHGSAAFGLGGLLESGREHWLALRDRVGGPPSTSSPGSLRREWERRLELVAAAVPGAGAGTIAYLTACALRGTEIDQLAAATADGKEPSDVVPEVPAG
ncbi:DUF6187 family protein [Amycolatopsis sp. NEAU-NG30]|uniref:DUF6187 family protein n=1 Tax=Amycolatopsis melonis TaxID=3156488 RepID=A0ABV0LU90_9PSEU